MKIRSSTPPNPASWRFWTGSSPPSGTPGGSGLPLHQLSPAPTGEISGYGYLGLNLAELGIPSETETMANYCRRTGRDDVPDWIFSSPSVSFVWRPFFRGFTSGDWTGLPVPIILGNIESTPASWRQRPGKLSAVCPLPPDSLLKQGRPAGRPYRWSPLQGGRPYAGELSGRFSQAFMSAISSQDTEPSEASMISRSRAAGLPAKSSAR